MHAEPVGDPNDRAVRLALLTGLEHKPDRSLTQLVRILPRCSHNFHPSRDESLHESQCGSLLLYRADLVGEFERLVRRGEGDVDVRTAIAAHPCPASVIGGG
jgi:hypothetical protein